MFKLKKSKLGFTLIELIVVLAILAIIAALAVPSYNGLKTESAQKVANANARTVYTAARAYVETTATTVPTTDDGITKENLQTMLGDLPGTYSATYDGTMITSAKWSGEVNGKTVTGEYTVKS